MPKEHKPPKLYGDAAGVRLSESGKALLVEVDGREIFLPVAAIHPDSEIQGETDAGTLAVCDWFVSQFEEKLGRQGEIAGTARPAPSKSTPAGSRPPTGTPDDGDPLRVILAKLDEARTLILKALEGPSATTSKPPEFPNVKIPPRSDDESLPF